MLILLVIGMFALWSSVFSIGKVALQYSSPFFLTGFRMALGGVLLLLFLSLFKRKAFTLSLKQYLSLCLLGFFSTYLTNVLEFWGLQYLSAAKTCFIYSLSPFFSALFSYIHFNEKMSINKWLGLSIGFAGCIPVLMMQSGSEELLSAVTFLSWPTLAVIVAALSSVYGWVLLRLVVKDQSISPPMANGVSMLFGGILAFIHSFFVESWNPLPVEPGAYTPFLSISILMTLLYNVVCYNLYGFFLRRYTATFLSFVGLLSPFFASLYEWFFFSHSPSPIIFASTCIVSLGLWVVYRSELRQGYIPNVIQESDLG